MIQPALLAYNIDNEDPTQPNPVLLDINSLDKKVILLLDTYFKVLIWEGSTIRAWVKAKYHEDPEYESLKLMIKAPLEDADVI